MIGTTILLLVLFIGRRFLPTRQPEKYRAVVTDDGVACEHPRRPREFILWSAVRQISLVSTSDGPSLPDLWIIFEGEGCGCSLPTEAEGFDSVMKAFDRFSGFDHGCFLKAETNNARYVCWKSEIT